jgi:hypothetical protein
MTRPPKTVEDDRICQLCFESVQDKKYSYIVSTPSVHTFLDNNALATPFLYAYLQHLRKKTECFPVCSNCDSWVRRQTHANQWGDRPRNRKSKDTKIILAVDRLILSIILPGTYIPPEMRIANRLMTTIRKNGGNNWLSSICPPIVVRTICDNDIRLASRVVLKGVCTAAWKSGRRQSIFGNASFAKSIRCFHQEDDTPEDTDGIDVACDKY